MSQNETAKPTPIWAYLLHLGTNMWCDRETAEDGRLHITARPYLRCDDTLWASVLEQLAAAGANMVVIDLGEGIRYESHPELGVRGSWTPKRLRRELRRLRELGLEPIPKLNFSACHDAWLGEYARCLSTERYYRVCADLIAEVTALFDQPRFFHLGMDEEDLRTQRHYGYVVIRQHELWWHDLYYLVEQVERHNVRAWVWSDYVWTHPEEFYRKMPTTVLQSNWYYGMRFSRAMKYVKPYLELDAHGYDQIPTGSNWDDARNFPRTVRYCTRRLDPDRLKGFMQAPWFFTLPEFAAKHEEAVQGLASGRALFRDG